MKKAVALTRSEEFRQISSTGAALTRALNASPVAEAVAGLTRSEEFRQISSTGAALARALNASPVAEAVAGLTRSEEFRQISSTGAALARALNASPVAEAVAGLARSEEFRQISSTGAALARALNASPVAEAVAGLARSEEFRRLSSVGAALAHSAKTFENSSLTMKSPLSSDHVVPKKGTLSNTVVDLIGDGLGSTDPGERGDIDDCKNDAIKTSLKPSLKALTPANCKRIELRVGFKLSFASVPVPTAVESCAVDTAFNPQCWQIFIELEQSLRQTVERSLEESAGPNWLRQRIPQTVYERWEKRQEEDRAEGRPVYSAVQYADFMDLADVITQRDNWREVFQVIFQAKNDIRESLRRLHPIRKAIAHSRPLSRDDVLTLVSEATRIYRVMGIRVLH